MQYPKKIMRKSELLKMGWDENELDFIYRKRADLKIAWKGTYKNSPIQFDTELLEKYRQAQCTGG